MYVNRMFHLIPALISSKKLCTHRKLVMFIENKQSQHFSSHTHKYLFIFPELHIIPEYFKTSWVNTLDYYLLIATSSYFVSPEGKLLEKFK